MSSNSTKNVVLACLVAKGGLYLDAREQVTLLADALVVSEAASAAFSVGTSLHAFVVSLAVLFGRAVHVILAHSVSLVLAWSASEQVAIL